MNTIFNLFTTKEILIMGVVVCSLILIVLILTIWDIFSKKRKESLELDEVFKEYDREEIKSDIVPIKKVDVEPLIQEEHIEKQDIIKEEVKEVNVVEVKNEVEDKLVNQYVEPLIMDIDDDIQVSNIETNETLEKQQLAKVELQKIEEELEHPKSLEDTLYDIETLEEENAIISYQDLLERTGEMAIVETDSGDEPISLTEVMSMYEEKSSPVIESSPVKNINEAYQGDFQSTPYLSPLSGYDKEEYASIAEIQLENTANLEKLDKEIRKTNEFLSILNDLKKNLE